MSEDQTKDLTTDEKLDLILTRLAKLEAFAEDRQRDTRPMLDKIHKELADTRAELKEMADRLARIERKFDVLTSDVMDLRATQRDVENRLSGLERKPS
jgi:septal ring factor EnvC (AmiA/AmiB activator)